VAIQTGSTYISDSMTDITAIHCNSDGKSGVFNHAQGEETDPVDCDDDRRPKMAIWTFCSQILQFIAVDRCRNHLANLLSSWTSSKIPNLVLEFRRYLSQFQRRNYFRFWRPSIDGLIPQICRLNFKCTFHRLRDISISGFGCHFRLSLISGIAYRYTSCEFATVECCRFAVGILICFHSFGDITTSG